jgi:hypothetical protein
MGQFEEGFGFWNSVYVGRSDDKALDSSKYSAGFVSLQGIHPDKAGFYDVVFRTINGVCFFEHD